MQPDNYVFGDYFQYHVVTATLDKLQWPTLNDWRHDLVATMMYKIVHNLIAIEASLYLTPITSATRGQWHSQGWAWVGMCLPKSIL